MLFASRSFPKWAFAVGGLFLLSCHSAGVRRAYMSLDSSGNRRLLGDNAVFFQDDSEIDAIAEVVSGRRDEEVGCRWKMPGAINRDAIQGDDVHVFGPGHEHDFAVLQYPGKGENIYAVCSVRKVFSGGTQRAEDVPWGMSGSGYVDWYIDGELVESVTFEISGSKRCIEEPCSGSTP